MRSVRVKHANSGLRAILLALLTGVSSPALAGQAISTKTFVDSLGINTHVSLGYLVGPVSPYYDISGVVGRLQYLGIRHIRDDLRGTPSVTLNKYATLGAAGDTLMLMMAPNHVPTPATTLAALQPVAPYIDCLEGPNEIDVSGISFANYSGNSAAMAYQSLLYTSKLGSSPFSHSKVVHYTFGNFTINPSTGVVSPDVDDLGNVHAYPVFGHPPYSLMAQAASYERASLYPIYMTETNYPTSQDNYKGVPEWIQARYLLDTLFDNTTLGFARTYIYELSDEAAVITNQEDNFGLFHLDGSPKPSATAIHNLTQILSSTGSGGVGSLNYTIVQGLTISAMNAQQFHLLLQKPGGPFELVVWAEPSLLNLAPPTPHAITVELAARHATVKLYDPLVGTTPTQTFTNANVIQVSTVDHPLILEISNP